MRFALRQPVSTYWRPYGTSLGAADRATLRHGMVLYDALYVWCRDAQGETLRWPPAMTGAAGGR
jgi:hypothetical protein